MPLFLKLLAPVVAGGVVAGAMTFGLVYSQTQAPDTNPASRDLLVYGDQN